MHTTKTKVTLKDQRDHLGGYNPDVFVEDPDYKKKSQRRGRKSKWVVIFLLVMGVLMVMRRTGLWQTLGSHPVVQSLPSFTHFQL